jgi:hypothetical protein
MVQRSSLEDTMALTIPAAIAGLALCLSAIPAVAGGAHVPQAGYTPVGEYLPLEYAHPLHVLYPAEVAPYIATGSVRRPLVLGRQGPRIAMAPERFHAYPYVSTFDRCLRHVRHGRHWHRIRVCG